MPIILGMKRLILFAILVPLAVGCSTTSTARTTTVQTEYLSAKPAAEPGVVPAGYRSPFDSGKDCKA